MWIHRWSATLNTFSEIRTLCPINSRLSQVLVLVKFTNFLVKYVSKPNAPFVVETRYYRLRTRMEVVSHRPNLQKSTTLYEPYKDTVTLLTTGSTNSPLRHTDVWAVLSATRKLWPWQRRASLPSCMLHTFNAHCWVNIIHWYNVFIKIHMHICLSIERQMLLLQ